MKSLHTVLCSIDTEGGDASTEESDGKDTACNNSEETNKWSIVSEGILPTPASNPSISKMISTTTSDIGFESPLNTKTDAL